MHTKENFGGLDAFRPIAALLVVAIHTSPLATFSVDADFFLTRILARISVPFFFMVTGQFVVSGFMNPCGEKTSGPWRYLAKISTLYLISILLYLPIGIYAGHYENLTLGHALKLIFFDGTFYHLWYFPACLTGVLTVFLMSRFLSLRGMLIMSSALYLIGLLGDSYFGLSQKLPVLKNMYNFIFRFSSYTRNGLFFAPLFLVLGAWVQVGNKVHRRSCETKSYYNLHHGVTNREKICFIAALCVTFSLMTAEAFCLRYFKLPRHDSMYIMLAPVVLFLYKLLLCLSAKPRKLLRNAALWIYILHPAFIVAERGIAKALGLTPILVQNSLVHYLSVAALSSVAGFFIAFLQNNLQKHPRYIGKIVLCERFQRQPRKPSCTGRAWIELDRKALAENVSRLCSLLPKDCRLMPAVKANAYGHGAIPIARELNRLGIDAFCVASLSEAISLRKAKVRGEILILGYTDPVDLPLLVRYHLTQTIIDYSYARQLAASGLKLHVHLAIDTGMHRLGIRCENIESILSVFRLKNLSIDGMFTHLSACDSATSEGTSFTKGQIHAFYQVAQILRELGFACPRLHLQSSYGLLNYPDLNADYARPGILLYGVHSLAKNAAVCGETFSPVLSLKARVASVRTLNPGDSAGYGFDFTAKEPTQIAVLSIGYADGLPRALSCGKGYVLIDGQRSPVIGRICMDLTLVDVTGNSQIAQGDIATIIGASGSHRITAEEIAEQCGTISNELLSRLGARLERFFIKTH